MPGSVRAAVDTDVVFKLACFAILDEFALTTPGRGAFGVLGAARFVVAGLLRKPGHVRDPRAAQECLTKFLATAIEFEPTDEEIMLAAEFEEAAAIQGLQLDTGESQLCAIVALRGLPLMVTGDKRAIRGAATIMNDVRGLSGLRGKIACLEQVIVGIVRRIGPRAMRVKVCAEPQTDKALSICFQCLNQSSQDDFSPDGLASYIDDLRVAAPALLWPGDALNPG